MIAKKVRQYRQVSKRASPRWLAVVALLIAVSGYSLWAVRYDHNKQSVTKAAGCTVSSTLVNSCRPWLAVAPGKYTERPANFKDQLLYHEERIGRTVDAAKDYRTAGQVLTSDDIFVATRANTYLMLNWKPATSWAAADGSNDSVNADIDRMADSIKSIAPKKIFLTIWHEPENDISTGISCTTPKGSSGSPTDFVKMYQNVHNRLQSRGATNVVYVLNYINYPTWDCVIDDMYPGDDYVDWILFNAYGGVDGRTFAQNISGFYSLLTTHSNVSTSHDYLSKPWGIAEWSARNTTETQGVTYFNQAKSTVESNQFSNLKLYLTFDDVGPEGNENRVAYAKGSVYSQAKADAYRDYARSAAFLDGATSPPPGDTVPPTVSVSSPGSGSTVAGTITVSANASDNVGVTEVKLWVDGTILKDDKNGSDGWNVSWATNTVSNGSHTIKVVAFDSAGNSATATSAVVVNNAGAPVISSFSASPTPIAVGATSTLTWSTTNANTCSVTPGGPINTTAVSWQTGALSATTTFSLSCTGAGGTVSKSVTVSIVPPPLIVYFQSSPSTITVGNSASLVWNVSYTTGCSITPGGPINTNSTSWQTLTQPFAGTITYTLTCKNAVGQTTSTTTKLTVNPAATAPTNVVLSANPTSITPNQSLMLSWVSVGSSSCTLNPGNYTASGSTSSTTITNLTTTTTYSVTCSNNAGSTTSNSVKITVSSAPVVQPPLITSLTATPEAVGTGGTSVIEWSTSNVIVDGCSLAPSPLSGTSSNGEWTTPPLIASTSYTLTCKNSANTAVSKSVSVLVNGQAAPTAPAPTAPEDITSGGGNAYSTDKSIKSVAGTDVVNVQVSGHATQGDLVTLDPASVADDATVKSIVKVEFYSGNKLIQTVSEDPYALNTDLLQPGAHTITQRTYFKDGSVSEKSQLVTITAKKTAVSLHGLSSWIIAAVAVILLVAVGAVAFGLPWYIRRYRSSRRAIDGNYGDSDIIDIVRPTQSESPSKRTKPHKDNR